MRNQQITDGTSQPLTAPGAVAGELDISAAGLTTYTLRIAILALSSATLVPRARIMIEETTAATWATQGAVITPVALWDVQGPIIAELARTWSADELPSLCARQQNAKLRAVVVQLDGGTPSITLTASLHTP